MDLLSIKKSTVCRHPKCHNLTPGFSLAQRGVLQLGLRGLDLMLRAAENPQKVEHAFVNLNRKLSGLKIRHQKVGDTTWPYLEGGVGEHVVLLHGSEGRSNGYAYFKTSIMPSPKASICHWWMPSTFERAVLLLGLSTAMAVINARFNSNAELNSRSLAI